MVDNTFPCAFGWLAFLALAAVSTTNGALIDQVTEDKGRARNINLNGPQALVDNVGNPRPTRQGNVAFRHCVGPSSPTEANYRSEFAMHSRWTGDPDGFCKLWVQVDGRGYELKVDYTGRTWWNNEDAGPYFKMGIYRNRQKTSLPPIELFTDEYRLGNANSDFHEVYPDQGGHSSSPGSARRPLPEGTVTFRDLPYVTNGHERQKLDLSVPRRTGARPTVMMIHGGGFRQGGKENPRGLAELLEAGFAVASINYRFSQHALFPAQIEDCKTAVRWLRAHAAEYRLDPARIGAWGGSAGGYLAAMLGTTGGTKEFDVGDNLGVSSRVQAVCDWYGPTDFSQMDAQVPAGVKAMKHNPANSPESLLIGGPIQENLDKVRRANPITYVTKDAPPFLIYHGEQDTSVPMGQSQLLADALKQAGADVTFETIPDDGHGLKKNGPGLVPKCVAFFVKELQSTKP